MTAGPNISYILLVFYINLILIAISIYISSDCKPVTTCGVKRQRKHDSVEVYVKHSRTVAGNFDRLIRIAFIAFGNLDPIIAGTVAIDRLSCNNVILVFIKKDSIVSRCSCAGKRFEIRIISILLRITADSRLFEPVYDRVVNLITIPLGIVRRRSFRRHGYSSIGAANPRGKRLISIPALEREADARGFRQRHLSAILRVNSGNRRATVRFEQQEVGVAGILGLHLGFVIRSNPGARSLGEGVSSRDRRTGSALHQRIGNAVLRFVRNAVQLLIIPGRVSLLKVMLYRIRRVCVAVIHGNRLVSRERAGRNDNLFRLRKQAVKLRRDDRVGLRFVLGIGTDDIRSQLFTRGFLQVLDRDGIVHDLGPLRVIPGVRRTVILRDRGLFPSVKLVSFLGRILRIHRISAACDMLLRDHRIIINIEPDDAVRIMQVLIGLSSHPPYAFSQSVHWQDLDHHHDSQDPGYDPLLLKHCVSSSLISDSFQSKPDSTRLNKVSRVIRINGSKQSAASRSSAFPRWLRRSSCRRLRPRSLRNHYPCCTPTGAGSHSRRSLRACWSA